MKTLPAVLVALVLGTAWAAGPPTTAPLQGEVLETMDAGSYTYLRLRTKDGEIWAAVMKAPVKKGAQVTIQNPMLMTQFESKTLKRTFDKIMFGTLGGAGTAASPGADYATAHSAMVKSGDEAVEKIARLTGPDARTVAEIAAQRAQLKGKTASVRGKVVKFTANVMGKNWAHLRDGSGSAADGSNDLLVTTKQPVQVGDVVIASGTVRTDVEVGAGYAYKFMLEDATLRK
jgi:hypothetical protein